MNTNVITLKYRPLVSALIRADVVSPTVQPRPWVLGSIGHSIMYPGGK